MTMDFEWELLGVDVKRGGRKKRENMVWLTGHKKFETHTVYDTMNVSWNLIEELCWTDGTRVNLFRSKGGKLFKLSPDKVGLITLHQKDTKTWYQSTGMMLEFNVPANGCEFEAWIDGDDLVFKPLAK